MFKDHEEELHRLEAELLREEENSQQDIDADGEAEQWEEAEYREAIPPGNLRAYNADRVDEDLEDFSREVYESGKGTRDRWIAAAALVLLAALLLILAFFAARYLGR